MATNPEGLKRWLEIHHHSQQKGAPAQPQRTTITFAKLATIRVPTLLMPGDQDLQAPPWVMRQQLRPYPRAQFIVLPEPLTRSTGSSPRLSPQRPGVHPQTLASSDTKIVVLINLKAT